MKVDYRLLLEQDPEVAEYVKECLYQFAKASNDFTPMIASIYTFYMSGMTIKQVTEWMINMNHLGGHSE